MQSYRLNDASMKHIFTLMMSVVLLSFAARIARADDNTLLVFAGQSKIFNAPWPVQRMAVTNPDIADVEAITPTQVMLLGRKVGTTDLSMWSANGEVWQRRVAVQIDLDRLRQELLRLFPTAALEVTQSQDVVVVSGSFDDRKQSQQLVQFLQAADKATGLKYANMTAAGQKSRSPSHNPGNPNGAYLDPAALQAELTHLFPNSDLEVRQTHDVFIISGVLRRSDEAVQLRKYIEAIESSANDYAQRARTVTTQPAVDVEGEMPDRQIPVVLPAYKFVDMTSVAGVQQVQLQVRVAEVSRTAIRALGINALKTGSQDNTFFGASTIGPSSGGALNPITIGPPENAIAGGENVPFTFNADVNVNPAVSLLLGFPRADLQFFLEALAENQYLRVLAEPNLVALSGEEANFLAGGEFPIPVVQGGGIGSTLSVTIDYKEFGVRLRFRPTVLGDNSIRLHVAPEVSELSLTGAVEIQGFRVPSLVTRRAETTLELKSGQTFSMAGLLNNRDEARSSRVPGLGDVPVLGAMFRSVRYVRGETELLVLVTASLVEPSSLACPPPVPGITDKEPNDWELYAEGRVHGRGLPTLSCSDEEWLRRLGFDQLEGPGGWETHDQGPARSEAAIARDGPTHVMEFGE